MKKKNIFFIMVSFLFVTLLLVYRIAGVGGRIIKVGAAIRIKNTSEWLFYIPHKPNRKQQEENAPPPESADEELLRTTA